MNNPNKKIDILLPYSKDNGLWILMQWLEKKIKKIETVGYLLSLMNNFVKYFFL